MFEETCILLELPFHAELNGLAMKPKSRTHYVAESLNLHLKIFVLV